MYKHLLVPVDGTALSTLNVSHAIQLAHESCAHISFLHARPDFADTAEGALLRNLDPAWFEFEALGDSAAILNKAEEQAAAHRVPCSQHVRVTDRPDIAIIEAASSLGCDLIVMASHGRRGLRSWLHGSITDKVLHHAQQPVLVTRVEHKEPLTPMERATTLLHDEHRSMAVVVKGMLALVDEAAQGGRLDVATLRAMLQYLRDAPERLHHPKEEQHLHQRMRQRHAAVEHILAELERQHQAESAAVRRLTRLVDRCAAGAPEALEALQASMPAFAKALWDHMALEEAVLLPLAKQHLLEEDWHDIAQAFEANDDPGFGRHDVGELRKLFTRIARYVPH